MKILPCSGQSLILLHFVLEALHDCFLWHSISYEKEFKGQIKVVFYLFLPQVKHHIEFLFQNYQFKWPLSLIIPVIEL